MYCQNELSWVSSAVPCAELPEVSISQWDYLLSVSPAHCLKNQLLWKSLFYTHWCTVCRVTHAKQTVLCRTSRTTFGDPLSVNTAVIHPAQPHDEPMAGQTQQKPCTSSSWASLWPSHSQLISTAFDLFLLWELLLKSSVVVFSFMSSIWAEKVWIWEEFGNMRRIRDEVTLKKYVIYCH